MTSAWSVVFCYRNKSVCATEIISCSMHILLGTYDCCIINSICPRNTPFSALVRISFGTSAMPMAHARSRGGGSVVRLNPFLGELFLIVYALNPVFQNRKDGLINNI